MIKVTVQESGDHNCWYINEESDIGVTKGKVGFKTREEATARARKYYPYVKINVEYAA